MSETGKVYTPKIIEIDAFCPACWCGTKLYQIGIDVNVTRYEFPCECSEDQKKKVIKDYMAWELAKKFGKDISDFNL